MGERLRPFPSPNLDVHSPFDSHSFPLKPLNRTMLVTSHPSPASPSPCEVPFSAGAVLLDEDGERAERPELEGKPRARLASRFDELLAMRSDAEKGDEDAWDG